MDNLSPIEMAQRCLVSLVDVRPYLNRDVIVALQKMANDQSYSDSSRGLEIAEIALDAAAFLGDELAMAWAIWSKGIAFSFAQYPQKALPFYRQAEAIFKNYQQALPLAHLQSGLVYILTRCGELEEALALVEEARPLCHRLGIDGLRPLGQLEMNVGSIYRLQGQLDLAKQTYERAMEAYTLLEAEFDIARIKINSANVYQDMDQYEQAEILYNEARYLLQQVAPESQELCLADFNLGRLANQLGHYQKALHHLELARDGFTPEAHIAFADMTRAKIYNTLGLYREALALARNAVQFYEGAKIPNNLAHSLQTQAVAWRGLGHPEEAYGSLLQAREHFITHAARRNVALIDLALAELALENHDIKQARQLASRLADTVDGELWPSLVGEAYLLQARILLSTTQLGGASTKAELQNAYLALQQALHFIKAHPQPELMVGVYHLLAQLHMIQEEPRAAWAAQHQALAYLETMRANLLLDEFRIGLMDEQHTVYLDGLRLLQNHALFDTPLDEQVQLGATFYLLNIAATAPLARSYMGTHPDPVLNQQLQDLRTSWHWQQDGLEKAQSSSDTTDDIARQDIVERIAAMAETESQIADLGRRLGIRRGSHQETAPLILEGSFADPVDDLSDGYTIQFQDEAARFSRDIQQQLAPREILLHYFTLDKNIYLLLVNCTDIVSYSLGSVAPIQQFQHNWEHHLQDSDLILDMPHVANKVAKRMLSALSQVLIEPILDGLVDSTHLYLVYPAEWHEIPFAALRAKEGYLIEQFQLTHLSTPEALLRPAVVDNAPDILPPSTTTDEKPRAVILGYSEGETLLYNLDEAIQVEQTLSRAGWQTTLLLEDDATLHSLYAAASQSQLLHLATHAFFQPENPLFSWARLADSQLTVADIYHQTPLLNQAMVVLSACETGRGQVRGGGLLGMARALLVSGARSLVVSLWRVEDQATAQLMEYFYEHMDATSTHASINSHHLCQAQRRLATTQHPFFWAGFVYIAG